jgi:hypothetical protein
MLYRALTGMGKEASGPYQLFTTHSITQHVDRYLFIVHIDDLNDWETFTL